MKPMPPKEEAITRVQETTSKRLGHSVPRAMAIDLWEAFWARLYEDRWLFTKYKGWMTLFEEYLRRK